MADCICSNQSQLDDFMSQDPSQIPVVESVLRNIQLPLSLNDYNFLLGTNPDGSPGGMNMFSLMQNNGVVTFDPRVMSSTSGLVAPSARLRSDFLLDSICIQVHCEPNSWSLDGNQFKTQALIDGAGILPDSPESPWEGGATSFADPRGGQYGIAGLTRCNAQFEFGGPTWRAANWFLQAYRLVMNCASSSNIHELLNERVVDLGNCRMGTNWQGFGNAEASELQAIQTVNTRLAALRVAGQTMVISGASPTLVASDPTGDHGYFLPFNCSDEMRFVGDSGAGTVRRTFRRMTVKSSAFGSMDVSPGVVQKAYRLPKPQLMSRDDNISIMLKSDTTDLDFQAKMFAEMALSSAVGRCISPVGTATDTRTALGDGTYTALANSGYVRVPGGRLRIGLLLRGIMLDCGLCDSWKAGYGKMDLATWAQTRCAQLRNEYGIGLSSQVMYVQGQPATDAAGNVRGGCGCSR